MKVKGVISNNTIVEGNYRVAMTTDTFGQAAVAVRLDTVTNSSSAINTLAGLYQEYLYKPGTSFTYVPAVGLTTPGSVFVAWLDNAEVMKNYVEGTVSQRNNIIANTANSKVYPIWQQFTVSLTAAPRLKKFDVNDSFETNAGAQMSSEFARSCQGMWAVGVLNGPVSQQVSISYAHAKLQLWGLRASADT